MVSRHLLRYLAVMVLAVLVPCMSDAATVVIVKTTSQVYQSQVNSFISSFFGNENSVSGLGARFTSTYTADAAVSLMGSTYPSAGITRRNDLEVGVSGLSGFSLSEVKAIVSEVYRVYARVTDMTLSIESESTADAWIALVNSGFVSGFSSAEKQKQAFLSLGGIIGIVIAVIVVGIVVAVGLYWKFLKSSDPAEKDGTADNSDIANKDDTADTTDNANTANKDDTADTTDNANIANKDDAADTTDNANVANKDDTADTTDNANIANKDDTADTTDNANIANKDDTADTCTIEVFPSPTNHPF